MFLESSKFGGLLTLVLPIFVDLLLITCHGILRISVLFSQIVDSLNIVSRLTPWPIVEGAVVFIEVHGNIHQQLVESDRVSMTFVSELQDLLLIF